MRTWRTRDVPETPEFYETPEFDETQDELEEEAEKDEKTQQLAADLADLAEDSETLIDPSTVAAPLLKKARSNGKQPIAGVAFRIYKV